jgi:tetratricopeptide (TPR) repeat protein
MLDVELERWASAAPLFERLLAGELASAQLRAQYVLVLAHLGRYDEVRAQIAQLPTSSAPAEGDLPVDPLVDLLLQVAWGLRDAGRDAEAEEVFRQALAREPARPEARLALLHLYSSAEERAAQQAAVDFQRAVETDAQTLYDEGSALLAAGDAAGALDMLARAAPQLTDGPLAESAWYNLGLAAYKLERWETAAEAFGKAAALNPERPETHLQRGMALHRLGRCADSVAALRKALELRPERREARYYLAECLDALGRREEAARERALYRQGGGGR